MRNRDIVWSYMGTFFQYGTSIIILPLILHHVSDTELGLWYTFSSVGMLVTYLDFGFSATLIRNITYAWSGAKQIKAVGVDETNTNETVDIHFVKSILTACRLTCCVVALIALVILLTAGTTYISYITREYSNAEYLWAWIIYAIAVFLNLYYNYCGNALKGIGEICAYQKIVVASRSIQILFGFVGITLGFGLRALSIAYLVSGIAIRLMANSVLRRRIHECEAESVVVLKQMSWRERAKEQIEIFRSIWYSAKRTGTISLCSYATNQSLTLICSTFLGIEETASYGLSLQIINTIIGVGGVLFATAHPQMISQMTVGDKNGYRKTFSMGMFMFWGISIAGIIAFGILSKPLLELIGSETAIPMAMYVFMAIYLLLDHNHGEFTAYYTMRNTIIYMRSYIVSVVMIVLLSFFAAYVGANIYILMMIHFIVQISYNNWVWPMKVMREMEVNLWEMVNEGFCETKRMLAIMLIRK